MGDHDVDATSQGAVQRQLQTTRISRFSLDRRFCLGRHIAVNKSYICYALMPAKIRIIRINTHTTLRVTDMAFFAEDVHLLASAGIDGRVNFWKISEGLDDENKPQITGKTVVSVQIVGEEEIKRPRVCWHCNKQEILVVGIGKRILRIDTNKVGKGGAYTCEAPLQCPLDKLADGIQMIGKHDGEVTDLSMCQWMPTRLVSASMDGTIKIWEDLKGTPPVVLRPHDGLPVYSAAFLTSSDRPDYIILITAGTLNREVKIWVSSKVESSDSDPLTCIQTLELKSSAEHRAEETFFNQVVALPQAVHHYVLDMCQCFPPLLENVGLEKSDTDVANVEGIAALDSRDIPVSAASINSADTLNEPDGAASQASLDSAMSQIAAMQEMLNQVAISSAPSLSGELAESERKMLALEEFSRPVSQD